MSSCGPDTSAQRASVAILCDERKGKERNDGRRIQISITYAEAMRIMEEWAGYIEKYPVRTIDNEEEKNHGARD